MDIDVVCGTFHAHMHMSDIKCGGWGEIGKVH